jgi:hypothetical protein
LDKANHLEQALQRLESADTDRLVDVLLNENQHERARFAALEHLLQRRDNKANEAIAEIIRREHKHFALRLHAVWSAGWQHLSSVEVIDALVHALRAKERQIRHSAAEALGAIGDPSAIEPLSAILTSEEADYKMKQSALQALGNFEPSAAHLPRLVEALVTVLQDPSLNEKARASAAVNLGSFPHIQSVDTLSRLALDDDEPDRVRHAAVVGLERLARRQVEKTPGQPSDLRASASYILDPAIHDPYWFEQVRERFRRYEHYLKSVREKFPQGARDYAFGPYHNCGERQCPHDSWLEGVRFEVHSSGDRSQYRQLDIHTRFLGSNHDGYIESHYRNVRDYLLTAGGDWMYDEVRLGTEGNVVHEIRFLADSHWLIECEDFTYQWKPLD